METNMQTTMQTLNINVSGMTCGGCVKSVKGVLAALPGMESADVDLATASAKVVFDPAKLDREKIAAAINRAGFDAA